MNALTTDSLNDARQRWLSSRINDYDMAVRFDGTQYDVHVRGGGVQSLQLDGEDTTSNRPQDYSVDGIFNILELELENLTSPNNPFGGDRRTTFLHVRFNRDFGYVERYLRAIGGAGRSHTIDVVSLNLLAP